MEESILPTFYELVLRQYSCAKKNKAKENLRKTLLYHKGVCQIFMKKAAGF